MENYGSQLTEITETVFLDISEKDIKAFVNSKPEKDMNVIFGSWAIKNKEMAAALEYAEYDHKFVLKKVVTI